MSSIVDRLANQQKEEARPMGRKILVRRKNLSNIYRMLQEAKERGIYKSNDVIDTKGLARAIGAETLGEWFNQAFGRCDDTGPTRSLGDLVGGHGLHLQKLGGARKYRFPEELPEVMHNCMYTPAVYSDGWVDYRLGPDA